MQRGLMQALLFMILAIYGCFQLIASTLEGESLDNERKQFRERYNESFKVKSNFNDRYEIIESYADGIKYIQKQYNENNDSNSSSSHETTSDEETWNESSYMKQVVPVSEPEARKCYAIKNKRFLQFKDAYQDESKHEKLLLITNYAPVPFSILLSTIDHMSEMAARFYVFQILNALVYLESVAEMVFPQFSIKHVRMTYDGFLKIGDFGDWMKFKKDHQNKDDDHWRSLGTNVVFEILRIKDENDLTANNRLSSAAKDFVQKLLKPTESEKIHSKSHVLLNDPWFKMEPALNAERIRLDSKVPVPYSVVFSSDCISVRDEVEDFEFYAKRNIEGHKGLLTVQQEMERFEQLRIRISRDMKNIKDSDMASINNLLKEIHSFLNNDIDSLKSRLDKEVVPADNELLKADKECLEYRMHSLENSMHQIHQKVYKMVKDAEMDANKCELNAKPVPNDEGNVPKCTLANALMKLFSPLIKNLGNYFWPEPNFLEVPTKRTCPNEIVNNWEKQNDLYSDEEKAEIIKLIKNEVCSHCGNGGLPLLWPSQFPNMPLTFIFYVAVSEKTVTVKAPSNKSVLSQMVWVMKRLSMGKKNKPSDRMITNSHFTVSKDTRNNNFIAKNDDTKALNLIESYQKVNRLPDATQLIDKEKISQIIFKMFPGEDIMPETLVLGRDYDQIAKTFETKPGVVFILKPVKGTRSEGISIVDRVERLKHKGRYSERSHVAQEYKHPYLIYGRKFDLRLFVMIASVNPLRIYLYKEGFARFASVPYRRGDYANVDVEGSVSRRRHLTDSRINKHAHAEKGTDSEWTLGQLWAYIKNKEGGKVLERIQAEIKDKITKTVIATEKSFLNAADKYKNTPLTNYEVFGVDMFLDENLKMWLLEFTRGPSTLCERDTERRVLQPLLMDTYNTAGILYPTREQLKSIKDLKKESLNYLAKNFHDRPKALEDKKKEFLFVEKFRNDKEIDLEILDKLTATDIRYLTEFEDELTRLGDYEPLLHLGKETEHYIKLMDAKYSYPNELLTAWKMKYSGSNKVKGNSRLHEECTKNKHLQPSEKYKANNLPEKNESVSVSRTPQN